MGSFVKTFFRYFIILSIVLGIIAIGIISGALFAYLGNFDNFDVNAIKMNFSSIVYYIDQNSNKPLEYEKIYSNENRVWVDIEKIPQHMQNAFIAIEDERFKKHKGIDLKRTFGAFFNYITKGKSNYGGSTITQQLIKNLTGDDEATPSRKIQEMWRSLSLEKKYSKDQILELYLNTIYLSKGCHGVQMAANVYFNKRVENLNLAESACIAGITQYPSKYDPIDNFENNKTKQKLVLSKMLELKMITKAEYEKAVNEKLKFAFSGPAKNGVTVSKNSYFTDLVINDVLNDLQKEKGVTLSVATKMLYSGGLSIYATVDPTVQKSIETVYEASGNFPSIGGKVKPEASMIILDPYNGEIKGVVGGRGLKTGSRTLNRATQSLRQPGSTIKPLAVYAPAIEYGLITSASMYDDAPITIDNWSPKNYYNSFRGNMTVRKAIEISNNIIPVRILEQLTIDNSFKFLNNNLSISSLVNNEKRSDGKIYSDKYYPSLALGGLTDGVSVLEMAAAYSTFVNKGIYSNPYSYSKVLDSSGKVILEKKKKNKIAMSEQTAYIMTNLLKGVIEQGTGSAAKLFGNMPACGKTGTTSDDNDRWFIGYTPYYVGACWFGYDKPQSMGSLNYNPNVYLWKKVMDLVHKNKETKDFTKPNSVVSAQICQDSGLLASNTCPNSRIKTEYFKSGTTPTSYCKIVYEKPKQDITVSDNETTIKPIETPTATPENKTDNSNSNTTQSQPSNNEKTENKPNESLTENKTEAQ